jgi:hypothetical protein
MRARSAPRESRRQDGDAGTRTCRRRDELVDPLQRKAYYGVAAVMNLGQDNTDADRDEPPH